MVYDYMLHLKHCKKFEKKWLFLSFCNSACISEVDYIKLHLNWVIYLLASFLHMKFSWCSGYHIWLPHRRSPVWSLVETFLLFFCFGQFSVINLFKNVSHVLSSQKSQLAIKNAAKIDNNWQKGIINNQFFHLNLPFALCVIREQCGSTEDHFCHVFSL